jgi:hypothetical protein
MRGGNSIRIRWYNGDDGLVHPALAIEADLFSTEEVVELTSLLYAIAAQVWPEPADPLMRELVKSAKRSAHVHPADEHIKGG